SIAGLEKPRVGEIAVNERIVYSSAKGVFVTPNRRGFGMVFQSYAIWPHMNVFQNAAFPLEVGNKSYSREEIRTKVMRVLKAVQLEHLADREATKLSGGQQQRLALARAWALRPDVLFLDEPTANLDPSATKEVESIITAIHATGAKIVMSTHNLGQARRLGDEVLFLHQGRLVERAPVETFFKRPASAEAAAFIKGELPWA
ncbi:MAG TPA: ABC transporter ATP-binding protein, partial [Steroidobacteraceae bacterium]|nr:ABC transporter ATP-binding protein [Steroidobacteraceae bacterium]